MYLFEMFYENFYFWIIFHLATRLISSQHLFDYNNDRRAILIVIGGMGRRSFDRLRMEKLFEKGAITKLATGFPTTNIATVHSIATGLYPKDHGVLMSPYLDFRTRQILTGTDEKLFKKKDIAPIWVTNQASGGKSICINWPGSDFEFKGVACSITETYTAKAVNISNMCAIAMNRLYDPRDQPNLLLMYYEAPESLAEPFGRDSHQYRQAMREVDDMIMYIYFQMKVSPFANRTSLFIIGTHDFIQVPQRFNISKSPLADIEATQKSFQVSTPIARFKFDPNLSNPKKYFEEFKETVEGSIFVVEPNRIPQHWRTDKELIGDTLILARPGTFFYDYAEKVDTWSNNLGLNADLTGTHYFGMSGFDNSLEAMKGFFWWYGNESKKTLDSPEIDVTDIKSFLLEALNNDKKSVEEDDTSGSSTATHMFSVYSLLLFYSLKLF